MFSNKSVLILILLELISLSPTSSAVPPSTVSFISIAGDGRLTAKKIGENEAPVAQVNFDTHLTDINSFPKPSGLVICFWLQPHRHNKWNTIMSVNPNEADRSKDDLRVKLKDGYLYLSTPTCSEKSIEVKVGEWTHFCLSLATKLVIFTGQTETQTSCDGRLTDVMAPPKFEFELGTSEVLRTRSIPYSGKIADLRIYFNPLTILQKKKISVYDYHGSYVRQEDMPGWPFAASIHNPSSLRSGKVEIQDLVAPYNPLTALFFDDTLSYFDALKVCTKLKAQLPDESSSNSIDAIEKYVRDYSPPAKIWLKTAESARLRNDCSVATLASASANNTYTVENCHEDSPAFACVFPKDTEFYMHSEDETYTFEIKNFISENTFESELFRIIITVGGLSFEGIVNKQIFYSLDEIDSIDDFLGRRPVEIKRKNIAVTTMVTFTTCVDQTQFTCTDGTCIDLSKVCDIKPDCPDFSDEETFCDVAFKLPKGYDKRMAPRTSHNVKVKLGVDFVFQRLDQVDITENTVKFSFYYKFSWIENRAKFKYLSDTKERFISEESAKKYWQPQILAIGAISVDEEKLYLGKNVGKVSVKPIAAGKGFPEIVGSHEALVFNGEDVKMYHSDQESITLLCIMNLFFFPFDIQFCNFSLMLQNDYTVTDAEFDVKSVNIDDDNFDIGNLYNILSTEVNFKEPSTVIVALKRTGTTTASVTSDVMNINMVFERKFGAYLYNTLLPSVMLELIGLLTLFLPLYDYTDRLAVTLACLIVMAGVFTQTSSSLPPSAGPRMIDIWMFVHIVLLFYIYLAHCLVIWIHNKALQKERAKERMNRNLFKEKWYEGKSTIEEMMSKTTGGIDGGDPNEAWGPPRNRAGRASFAQDTLPKIPSKKAKLVNSIGLFLCTIFYVIFLVGFFVLTFIHRSIEGVKLI